MLSFFFCVALQMIIYPPSPQRGRHFFRRIDAVQIKHLTNGAKSDILSERSKDSRYLYGVNPAEDGIIF